MVFWLAILAGGLFAWFAVKIGFYDTWAMLFNIVISVYLAVFLTPLVAEIVPAIGNKACCNALTSIAIALGSFFILYGISYTFITGQFSVSFPKIFDLVFAGLLGFMTGFLVLSFIAFLLSITPVSNNEFVKEIGFNRQSQQPNLSYIGWWCDLVNGMVASKSGYCPAEQAIDWFFESAEEKKPPRSVEPNEPKAILDSNDTIKDISEEILSPSGSD